MPITKSRIIENLSQLQLTIPEAATPAAAYAPWVISGNMLIISGQLPIKDGQIVFKGILGDNISDDNGYLAAQLCGLNIIGQINAALDGDFSRLTRIIRLGGFVQSSPDFKNQPQIINGASELMQKIFGDTIGVHARAAVGVAALPFDAAVEIDAMVEILPLS